MSSPDIPPSRTQSTHHSEVSGLFALYISILWFFKTLFRVIHLNIAFLRNAFSRSSSIYRVFVKLALNLFIALSIICFVAIKNPVNRRGFIFAYFLQCLVAEFYHVKLAHNFTDEEADTNRNNKQAQGNAKAKFPVGYDTKRCANCAKHTHKT